MRTRALGVIKDYLGDMTARVYADFYQKQDAQVVLDSVHELLEEYVGSARAAEILTKNGLNNITSI